MPLTLWDVKRDPIASRALEQLGDRYTVAEEKTGLVLTGKAGDMKLFLNELDDLHQWDFIHNQKTATENEKLRSFSQNLYEQRESWKYRALVAEATLLEVADASNNGGRPNISAPGNGLEKIVRNEIFKEIWGEVERLDNQTVSADRSATARSSAAI